MRIVAQRTTYGHHRIVPLTSVSVQQLHCIAHGNDKVWLYKDFAPFESDRSDFKALPHMIFTNGQALYTRLLERGLLRDMIGTRRKSQSWLERSTGRMLPTYKLSHAQYAVAAWCTLHPTRQPG